MNREYTCPKCGHKFYKRLHDVPGLLCWMCGWMDEAYKAEIAKNRCAHGKMLMEMCFDCFREKSS